MNDTTSPQIGFVDSFVDARGCRQWLKTLPLTNVTRAAEAILGQLALLREAPIRALQRVRIAETLREPIGFLHLELAKRFAGKPVPFGARELEAARLVVDLWHGLWGQYSQCLKALIDGDDEMRASAGRLLQRAIFAGKQQILAHGLARRELPAAFWRELHAFYRFAEILESTRVSLSDPLIPGAEDVSCYSTYSHALLLALADPFALSVRQLELVDRWLAMWSRKAMPSPAAPPGGSPLLAVDLEGNGGFAVIAEAPAAPRASLRFAQTAKLASSVGGRVKKLLDGESPASLKLGDDCQSEACVTLLKHLYARWCLLPKRLSADAVESEIELCGGGLPAMYFRLTGQSVRQEEPPDRTFQAAQRLAVLDAVAGYDPNRDQAERDWPWERWQGVSAVTDAMLARTGVSRQRWQLDQIVACRESGDIRIARVSWLAEDACDAGSSPAGAGGAVAGAGRRSSPVADAAALVKAIADESAAPGSALGASGAGMGIRLDYIAGRIRPVLLRSAEELLKREPAFPALLVRVDGEPASTLLVPPRTFAPGRRLRPTTSQEPPMRLARLIERGADYERVAFEPV